jgi:6,7-dimethyl-8-ribityllumazine synthase
VVVSRFNEGVTRRLLEGALRALGQAGYGDDLVDVVWVPGAFELPLAIARGLEGGAYGVTVALGAVIRGETPHFDYVSAAASHGLMDVALRSGVPVGFGLLTCDTLAQAMARAGGAAGHKGEEAAKAALDAAEVLAELDRRAQT